MTEALHLGKPYLAVPVSHQLEQTFNAYWLEKSGYGAYWEDFSFIIFAFEITRDYNSVLPLMLVAVIADGILVFGIARTPTILGRQ